MLAYNLRMAARSLRRNPALTTLTVAAIALGVAVSSLFSTMRHSLGKDPIPDQSARVYNVRLDSWDPQKAYPSAGAHPLPPQVTYRDAKTLLRSPIPVRQTASYQSMLVVAPDVEVGPAALQAAPERIPGRLTFSDFFAMFEVPFEYGGPWGKAADEAGEPVAVLSHELNQKLFGGQNSVGKTIRIAERSFRVCGVLKDWHPAVRYYDMTNAFYALPEQVFLPFTLVEPMQLGPSGNTDGWGPQPSASGLQGLLVGETTWIQMWVELADAEAVAAYHSFLDGYALEQRKGGRFLRPLNNQLTRVPDLMVETQVVPPQLNTMLAVSVLFLLACALNLTGLLLAKFLSRAHEVGVRRALGARRSDVFLQHLLECELLALGGGAIGLALAWGGLKGMNLWAKTLILRTDVFQLDLPMGALAVAFALGAGLCAGAYPAWRICRLPPALSLKWS